MMINNYDIQPVGSRERIQFCCTRCGDCCRHVREAVLLESFDAYQLAKFLRQSDPSIKYVEDVLLRYATPEPLTDSGFPIYLLKVWGDDDACVFLKDNRCSIYPVRPRACRLYPLTLDIDKDGQFQYLLCREKPHHFVGGDIRVRDWVREHFKREYQEFVRAEYDLLPELGRIVKRIDEGNLPRMIVEALFRRYYNYDLDAPFMPQYKENMAQLRKRLTELAANTR